MINYHDGAFGFHILFRFHGSAVFRSILPATLSSIIYILLFEFTDLEQPGQEIFDHPYPMGALVAAFTFLLAFRANFSYNRYWEAFGAIHQMHSKWIDFSTEVASFHYQSSRYDAFKPPAFGKYPHVQDVHRERERLEVPTKSELQERIENIQSEQNLGVASQQQLSIRSRFRRLIRKSKSKAKGTSTNEKDTADDKSKPKSNTATDDRPSGSLPPRRTQSVEFVRNDVLLSNKGARQNRSTGDVYEKAIKSINRKPKPHKKGFKNERLFDHNLYDEDGKPYSSFVVAARKHLQEGGFPEGQPSLFLEEVAHLLSLLSAVAMSTLRNDLEEAESPLIEFTPGAPWPHVDPDAYASGVRKGWERHGNPAFTIVRYLFGVSRTDTSRTLYNAARPFRVIGNVSDAEIEMLQAARGPFAKTALCSMWLQEFISREYMSGSTGKVAPPIISRLYQFTSDGMSAYNQARKIAYTPFPLPHSQLTTLFVLVIIVFMPILMLTYLTNEVFGFILNGLTVMCFSGLHEVARELEAPFQNVPNDVPLNNFQAQFNEAIMTIFYGYHPDLYWHVETDPKNSPEKDEGKSAKPSMAREETPLVEESPVTQNKQKLDQMVTEMLPSLDSD